MKHGSTTLIADYKVEHMEMLLLTIAFSVLLWIAVTIGEAGTQPER